MTDEQLTQQTNSYLTITALTNGTTINFIGSNSAIYMTISVSINNGLTWTEYTSSSGTGTPIAILNTTDKLLIKGTNSTYASSTIRYNRITSDNNVNLSGNIMSLIYGDNFSTQKTLSSTYTFNRIFYGLKVVDASYLVLPATTLTNYCYRLMFQDCTSLVNAPELPATTLASKCYYGMFSGCTSLVNAPELPATTLSPSCYFDMFQDCTTLFIAPVLPATTLASNCYSYMFFGCSNLYYIKALFTTTPSTTYTENWVSGVSNTGMFLKNIDAEWDVTGINGIPTGWTVYGGKTSIFTISSLYNNVTVSFWSSSRNIAKTISVSTDNGSTWTEYTSSYDGTTIATLNQYEMILIKGSNSTYSNGSLYTYFKSSNFVNISGNIMSLIYGDNFIGQTTLTETYVFAHLFSSLKVVDASYLVLPATTLTNYCYAYMFQNCTSLTEVPKLPATTLATQCYRFMFSGCTSLTEAPKLPATTLAEACYIYMFHGCTSLTTAPELPAETLVSLCYQSMFEGCTSLNDITALFTTTPSNTYTRDWVSGVASTGTFKKNSKATWDVTGANGVPTGWTISYINTDYLAIKALENNTTISFKTNNSDSANTISVSTDNGFTWTEYTSSTSGVTIATLNTNDIVLIKGSNSTYYNHSFVSDKTVDISGNIMSLIYGDNYSGQTTLTEPSVFANMFSTLQIVDASNLKLPATTLSPACYGYMFSNCTSLVSAPELPATTLSPNCYLGMFMGCTSLVNAPELPATTLAEGCYYIMFAFCNSLVTAPVLPAKYVPNDAYLYMFMYCNSLNFIEMLCISFEQSISTFTQYYISSIGPTEGTFVADPTATWVNRYTVPQYWDIKRKYINIGDCNIFYVDSNSNVRNVSALYLGSIPVQMTL